MSNPEIRKLLVAGFDQLLISHGYSRRRKADPFVKAGGGWCLRVNFDATITYGRVKGLVVFRGTIEPFEARLAEAVGREIYESLMDYTFITNNRPPENPLLELLNGADDIPSVLGLIQRSLLEVEAFAVMASERPSVLMDEGRVDLVRSGFACWESGDRRRARALLEEARVKGSPELRVAADMLLERLMG